MFFVSVWTKKGNLINSRRQEALQDFGNREKCGLWYLINSSDLRLTTLASLAGDFFALPKQAATEYKVCI